MFFFKKKTNKFHANQTTPTSAQNQAS